MITWSHLSINYTINNELCLVSQSTLQEKKCRLGSHRSLHSDILAHESNLASLVRQISAALDSNERAREAEAGMDAKKKKIAGANMAKKTLGQ